jgi:hypothetical protein
MTMIPELVLVQWDDAHNNQGAWVYGEDGLNEFATDERFQVSQAGWLVYEDDKCVVIASRITRNDTPERAYGQLERIPKRMITERSDEVLNDPTFPPRALGFYGD